MKRVIATADINYARQATPAWHLAAEKTKYLILQPAKANAQAVEIV